ncbi:ABC transporter ATP-binding protein [Legionella dresdenensis]|uniref:ABC transporter ATP-binding protein n=1 Tax=Legionella dresdenensis TaxID=450200 RepID=A0ABV8CGU2_9GAMM
MDKQSQYIITENKQLPNTLLRFFWLFLKKQPVAFAVFFLAPASMILETNIIPYALKMIVDGIGRSETNRENIFQVLAPALWLGGCSWFGLILIIRLQNWWQAYVIPRFQAQIRMTALDYLTRQSFQYFADRMAGSLANKINDLPRSFEAIRLIISWNVIATLAAVIATLIILTLINAWFTLMLASWLVLQVITSWYFANRINRYSEHNAHDKSKLSGKIVDTLANIGAVKLFSRHRDEMAYIAKTQQKEVNSNKRLINFTNLFRLSLDIPATIMLVVMVYLMLSFWQKNLISSGDIVYIFSAVLSIMNQVWFLGHALADLFREVGVARQALSIITVPIKITDVENAEDIHVHEGKIEFKNVSFRYHQDNRVFDKKSVVIEPRQRVGLVGYSGSGKTTFVNLILRFYNLDSGQILIDGQDISQVTQDSLRASISMIPQDPVLFHRSLLENIGYGKKDATAEEIIAAAQRASCHDFIRRLPEGYDTLVGERGIKLSGGQRQRIAIARAILKNTNILILDEATSQLDSLTEEQIQHSLLDLMTDKTTLVVAHRLSTLLRMDRILVFDKGKIIEDGPHSELIAKSGLYKAMWDAQVGGFLPEKVDWSHVND